MSQCLPDNTIYELYIFIFYITFAMILNGQHKVKKHCFNASSFAIFVEIQPHQLSFKNINSSIINMINDSEREINTSDLLEVLIIVQLILTLQNYKSINS